MENSWYWPGTTVGDATDAPYDDDEFSDIWRKLFLRDRTLQGIIDSYENELVVTNPAGNTIRVATGAALADGKFYETDANVDNVIATPAALTRIDRVVLRKSWAAQTVRVVILTGIEGGAVPALTQNDGVTWEIPLAQVSITVVPAITITDERVNARTPLAPEDAGSLRHIETIEADGVITSFDFTGIAATFRHLLLIGQVRNSQAAVAEELEATFNADSGNNYNSQTVEGVNATPGAVAVALADHMPIGPMPGSTAEANHAGEFRMEIPFYAETDFFKTVLSQSGHVPNDTVANFSIQFSTFVWQNTSAITRITIQGANAAAFVSGSRVSLYGIN